MNYIRKSGFVARKSGGYLVLYHYLNRTPIILHPSAVFLYSLVDGTLSKEEIFLTAKAAIKNQIVTLDTELEEAFDELLTLGVVIKSISKEASPNFLSVGFEGFWKDFNADYNYFSRTLSEDFVPIIVDSNREVPSIIVINDSGIEFPYDHKQHESISIGFISEASAERTSTYDLEINTVEKKRKKSRLSLPLWAIHFPWDAHQSSSTPTHHLEALKLFSPTALSEKIYLFLKEYYKEEVHQNENEESSIFRNPSIDKSERNGKLTIGMATYDDYDGPYFTLQSIRLYHQEVLDRIEFIILDNNPGGPVGAALKSLEDWIPNYRYLPYDEYNGTTTREVFFVEANTEYVMSVDSHVMLMAGSLKKLLDYLDQRPDSMDLYQGPMLYDDVKFDNYSSGFRPEWSTGMYGVWVQDQEAKTDDAAPFEINMQGLGMFVCRKAAWQGFNSRFRGFGGEEGYIHEKFRQAGYKTYCLPFLRWLHRFGRPNGAKYPNIWEDRIRNYYLGFNEIGWDKAPIDFHFSQHLGSEVFGPVKNTVLRQLKNPLYFFDGVYLLVPPKAASNEAELKEKIKAAGLGHIFRLFRYRLDKNQNPEFDMATEEVIDRAVKYRFKHILVVQDKASITPKFYAFIEKILEDIDSRKWGSLHIGTDEEGQYISTFNDTLYTTSSRRPPNNFMSAYNLTYLVDLKIKKYLDVEQTVLEPVTIS